MEQNSNKKKQNIILENREKIIVSGVKSVESFDEQEIITVTENGVLNIRGENIKIGSYNEEIGELNATGDFFAAVYVNDNIEKGGFFNRLFK